MSIKPVAWTPGPWGACRHGECSCGQVWSVTADHPVATVITGVWGDTYPAIRLTEGPGMSGTTAEAYLERMDYGSVDKNVAAANARLIASAPELAEALQELTTRIIDCAGDCPHSVVTLAHGAILLLARITPK